jgi:uncharacterized protein (TIGR00251 family)
MVVRVRVTPRAARARLAGVAGSLRAWITAPAEDGRANEALRTLVAEALQLRRSEVAIIAGQRSREKTLEIADRAAERLRLLLQP